LKVSCCMYWVCTGIACFQARAIPKAAARIANPELALRDKAPLWPPVVLVLDAVLLVPVPELLAPLPVGAVALAAGGSRAETPLPIGPGAADAEAPTPTNAPTVGWPGVPEADSAALWNFPKLLAVAAVGALIAPTMPAKQCAAGFSCLQ